ncbi:MAG: septum formation family protein [Acidimicrobiia bacterium]|nr:septum formation family protein [Acidimicrobiia bacterium]
MRKLILAAVAVMMTACGGSGDTSGGNGDTSVFALEVGDCFDDPAATDEISTIEVIDCEEPHDNEVSDLPQYPAGEDEPYPGDSVIDDWASETCLASFEAYVGLPYNDSVLVVGTISPRAGTWTNGDREIVCIVYEPDVKLTDVARNSRR